jgi:cytochrome c556
MAGEMLYSLSSKIAIMSRYFLGFNRSMRDYQKVLAVILCALVAACGEPADTHPGQPVTHRRAAFEKILHAFEPMGVQLRGNQYNPDKFLERAKELVSLKDGPWQYFGPDTNYPPTHATAKVWAEPAQFEKERQAFMVASGELLLAAESRDEKKVTVAYEALHQTCRSCHKAFKEE